MEIIKQSRGVQIYLTVLGTIVLPFGFWCVGAVLGYEVYWEFRRVIDPNGLLLPLAFCLALFLSLPFLLSLPVKWLTRAIRAMANVPLINLMLFALWAYHGALQGGYRP
jgi:hypothetical protein